MVDQLEVPAGLESALGAALGEELESAADTGAARHWRELPPLDPLPALPDGVTPLAELVRAPPTLARALSQIGLAENGEAAQAMLRPGQILVSREGAMWRWDGYVIQAGTPTPAAIRLQQRNRFRQLRTRLAEAASVAEQARAALGAAEAAEQTARTQAAAAEQAAGTEAAAAERTAAAEAEAAERTARTEAEATERTARNSAERLERELAHGRRIGGTGREHGRAAGPRNSPRRRTAPGARPRRRRRAGRPRGKHGGPQTGARRPGRPPGSRNRRGRRGTGRRPSGHAGAGRSGRSARRHGTGSRGPRHYPHARG